MSHQRNEDDDVPDFILSAREEPWEQLRWLEGDKTPKEVNTHIYKYLGVMSASPDRWKWFKLFPDVDRGHKGTWTQYWTDTEKDYY